MLLSLVIYGRPQWQFPLMVFSAGWKGDWSLVIYGDSPHGPEWSPPMNPIYNQLIIGRQVWHLSSFTKPWTVIGSQGNMSEHRWEFLVVCSPVILWTIIPVTGITDMAESSSAALLGLNGCHLLTVGDFNPVLHFPMLPNLLLTCRTSECEGRSLCIEGVSDRVCGGKVCCITSKTFLLNTKPLEECIARDEDPQSFNPEGFDSWHVL